MDNNILKEASLKATKKRIQILSILENESAAVTAEYVYNKLSEIIEINLSTVYRALNAMTDKNILTKTVHSDGKTYYKLNNSHHKHELVCSVCHKSVKVDNCPFDIIADEIAKKTGFVITGHSMEFTGICPDCIVELNK